MMTMREKLQRLATTVAALAVTVGVVFAMREITRDVVVRFSLAEAGVEVGEPPMPLEPAPRVYDLGELVPPDLAFNVGGMACTTKVRHELAPVDVSLERVCAEAEAMGWYRIKPTVATMMRAPGLAMEESFYTPQGEFVSYGLLPDGDGVTRIAEWRFPFKGVAQPAEKSSAPLQDAAAQCGPEIRRRLPAVIGELVDGNPIQSQLIPRNGGHGYYLTYVSSYGIETAPQKFAERAAEAGWARAKEVSGEPLARYVKENLSLFCQFVPYATGHCIVICRFSDDENVISTQKTNKKRSNT